MGLKDWIAPFITLLIGASTIFISYKNYQAQAAAKPSELARLELWSKLLTEAGLDLNALPDPEKLTSDQRVVLENYRVFLKRASLESKLRKVGIDSNRIFSLLMKRAHSSVKPTPIPIGDSVRYYRLILRGLLYIWVPLAVIFIGVPIIVVTIAYLIGLFTNHRGNLSDFALSPLAVVLLIVGAVAVGSLVYLQNRIISAIIANNVYFYFWDIYGSKKGARDSKDAYSERLAAKTYADQLFLGQQGGTADDERAADVARVGETLGLQRERERAGLVAIGLGDAQARRGCINQIALVGCCQHRVHQQGIVRFR